MQVKYVYDETEYHDFNVDDNVDENDKPCSEHSYAGDNHGRPRRVEKVNHKPCTMILVMTKMMMLLLMMMMMIMIMMIMIMMIMIMVIMIMIIIITILVIRHVRSKMVGLSPNKENWPLLGRFASKQYDGGL